MLLEDVEMRAKSKLPKNLAQSNTRLPPVSKRLQRNILHNSQLPISIIPHEILDDIFLLYQLASCAIDEAASETSIPPSQLQMEGLLPEQILLHVSHS